MCEFWAVLVKSALNWLNRLDNHLLDVIVNLLTISVIIIGLTNWTFGKMAKKRKEKNQKNNGNVIDTIAGTQKSFKTVKMLDNPMESGEKIGDMVEIITHDLGGRTMSKFFRWLWYNKEQLFSIIYNVIILVLSQVATFAGLIENVFPNISGTALIIVKVVVCVVSLGLSALTVRNVCVKYGLSSLDTIDKVLAEKASEASKKLSPEERKAIKAKLETLQDALDKTNEQLTSKVDFLNKMTDLYNADERLVHDYIGKKKIYDDEIAEYENIKCNLESKIEICKAQLNGAETVVSEETTEQ